MKIIINADDFGYSKAVNEAIDLCMVQGLISSTTLMANMPFASEAVNRACLNKYEECIGAHITLTEGKALSRSILNCNRLVDKDGFFQIKRNSLFWFTKSEGNAIKEEIDAQISWLKSKGLRISHVDSHHHIHTEFLVLILLCKVCKKYGITKIRLPLYYKSNNILIKIYKYCIKFYVFFNGFKTVDYFVDKSMLSHFEGKNVVLELMVHPIINGNRIIDSVTSESIEGINFGHLFFYDEL